LVLLLWIYIGTRFNIKEFKLPEEGRAEDNLSLSLLMASAGFDMKKLREDYQMAGRDGLKRYSKKRLDIYTA
jgi:hypothetical protein